TLFPVLGFLNVYPFRFSYVANHFQYLACLGIIAPVSAAVALLFSRAPVVARWAGQVACVALLGVLGSLSWHDSAHYVNAKTLYQATIEKSPESRMVHTNLASILIDEGKIDEAKAQLEEARRIEPRTARVLLTLGRIDFDQL